MGLRVSLGHVVFLRPKVWILGYFSFVFLNPTKIKEFLFFFSGDDKFDVRFHKGLVRESSTFLGVTR